MEESIDQRDEQRKFNYWDIFRKDVSAQRVTRKSSLSDKIFKGLKLLVYVILFLLVFGGAIVSRAALQILTDQLYLERQTNYTENLEKDAISYFLLFIISIPDGVKFIVSLMQFLFGKRQSPSCIQLIVVILKECLHFFCLGTIVFKVMPLLNTIEVCAYLSGIPLVPSFLHSISYRKKCLLGGRHIGKQMLNILSIILQAAALFGVPIYKVTNDQISSTDTFLMIFCAFCFSVRWFETYFKYSRESKLFKKLFAYEEREKTHAASSLVTSLFRLVLAVALFPTFFSPGVKNPVETFSSRPFSVLNSTVVPTPCLDISKNTTIQLLNKTILPCNLPSSKAFVDDWLLNPFLIHFFTSIGLFYGAIISTRLCMDKVCFCIALTFGTPVYVTGVFVAHIINEPNWISNTLMSKDVTDTGVYTLLVVFVIAWLSQLWTCRHIWYSSYDRMVFVSRLFVLPHYCSPVADLSLLHSRRHKSKHFEDVYQEDDSVKTKVYICATMWHENRIEMKQILKTLFRLDMDQAARSIAKNDVSLSASTESVFESGLDKKAVMRDYYEFEVNSEIQQMKEKVKEDFESVQSIFERLPPSLVQQAENTYVMALDGDVDFSPEALQLLIDRMKKNTKVGATCGRIKPGGSGPVVWYQKFEYAIGHWLQKSAEHVFGCVLCSPGCFSLFRAKALMDDNIMRTYAKLPTEPKHYLQYDQGEDRWLCTLMLQQGYRIEYCAAAEALTFAPEEFREFFNQRRRWMPSTMANILDLLMSYTQTTRNNPNISYLYIFYQKKESVLYIISVRKFILKFALDQYEVIVKECLHFFSLGTIVFKVLPLLNAVEVCTYLSGTPLVPSILHSILYKDESSLHTYKPVLNIISIISQAAAVFAVPIYKVINNQISYIDTFLMVFCSICVSVRWLETYFEYVAEIFNKIRTEKSQTVSSLVASLSRLLLAVILFPTFFAHGVASPVETFSSRPSFLSSTAIPTLCINLSMNTTCELQSMNTTSEPQHMNTTSELQSTKTTGELKPMNTTSELQFMNTTSEPQYMNTSSELQSTNTTGELKSMDTTSELQSMDTTNELQNTTFFPSYIQSSKKFVDDWLLNLFLIHFFTSIVLFYGAVISIRLCMDRVSFCTALTFGTPIYVTGVVVAYIVNGPNWISNTLMSKQVTDTEVYFMLLMFLTAWLSQLWTCRHIWFSSHDRMAFVGRLFVLPHYCSPVADLSILHSRRQKYEQPTNNNVKADPVQTKVYICATMWHENRTEMKQFLKTLFRLDLDQAAHYLAKNEPGNETSEQNREAAIRDYYEFEAHIMFDDAMETTQRKDNGEKKREPNEFACLCVAFWKFYNSSSVSTCDVQGPLTVLNEELAFLTHSNDKLSFYDIADITDTYKCAEECVNPPECINGGFVYSECECYCPYGLTGQFCEQVTSDDCGGIIDLTPGNDYTITSPNFPNNYDVGKECVWLLRAPEDYRVRVDVDFLHLPYNDDLKRCYHWLQVRYNLVGQTGIRKCGDSTGDTWVTTPWGEKNLMLLIFDSVVGQGHSPEKGFSLRARTVKDGCSADPCIYGTCEDCDDGSFKCKCFPGFEGQHCEFVDDSTPLECTFEKHYKCFMKNVDNDDFDWSEKMGPTVTKLTGPDKAISGDLYLYAESSSPRQPGDRAIFESDVTFPAEDRCLEFYFNMFGSGMGTLTVKSSEDVLWSKTENQGFSWHKAKIHIPSTDNLKLRIEATRGSDYESDIAIDDIKLSPGTCEPPTKSDCLSSPKGTDYRGKVNVTTNGKTCQRWDANSPWSHSYHVYDEYDNYCRNDLHDSDAPWCYTTDAQVQWELCDIPHCHIEECVRSMNGYDYLGTKDTTIQGQTCEPNKDGVRACRGSFDYDFTWCFIDQNENWDSCEIPKCTTPPAECLQTPKGIDYFGSTAVTETGITCQRWDKQEPHQHKFWALVDQDNYCRNPDGDSRPWCYTIDPDIEFDYCKISYCDELACSSNPCEHGGTCTDTENGGFNCQCRSGYIGTMCESRSADDDCKRSKIGYEYNGKIHETKNKFTCQEWAKDDPHSHRFNNLPENYCRNPDQDVEPWCFTTDPNKVYDFCDIPFCTTPAKECLGTDNGISYFGTMKQTKDGTECQSWSAQTPHSHKYGYLEDQGNYCRNPDQDENGPWCLTTDPDIQWQSCDIPHC
ncbi:chitin synthase [Mytilus galloprovincialis]|uniref:chitin synthase n=1 Tax=Mytilus galloprovincialis TaxID=29158 RepID=A0A8B6H3I4_MYTGA|nr:chitin synthase [Mytilus galloprovincialis]